MRYKQKIMIANEWINAKDYPDYESNPLLIEYHKELNECIRKNDKR